MGKKLRSVGGLKREVQKPRMLGHSSAIGMRMLLVLGLPLCGRGVGGGGGVAVAVQPPPLRTGYVHRGLSPRQADAGLRVR